MKSKVKCEQVPIFCGLVVSKGFDPEHQGPPRAGKFPGFGIDYSQYAIDLNGPEWRRPLSVEEMVSAIKSTTQSMPTVGAPDGAS